MDKDIRMETPQISKASEENDPRDGTATPTRTLGAATEGIDKGRVDSIPERHPRWSLFEAINAGATNISDSAPLKSASLSTSPHAQPNQEDAPSSTVQKPHRSIRHSNPTKSTTMENIVSFSTS